ncbi:MAG: multicopper oxidase family protein, partial [Burkholderiaceae bacterium]
ATDGDPREALGTLWYHDHREEFTASNVYRGLAGFYLLFDAIDSGNERDTNPKALRLPSGVGKYDIPLMISDPQFDSSGYLKFDQFETDGMLGDKFAVNGKIQPYFKVARRKYRFRLLNASPTRFYEFFLVKNGERNPQDQTFTYIANDGNLLPAPLTMKSVRMAPAERADIIVDFSKFNIGDQIYLVNRLKQDDGRRPGGLTNEGVEILRFDVERDEADYSRVPAKLRDLPPINLAEVVKHRHWEFDRERGFWTVNNKIFDIDKPAAVVKRGTAEIWTLEGKGSWQHPVHIHMEEFRILSRNGKPPPPHERGRKDVVVLHEGEEVRIFIRFRDFTGKYLMHCHNTVHEDHGMMVRFDVVP